MKRNIESNREKLSQEEASNMDLDSQEEYIRDQFEEYYKTLTPTEFDEQWERVFGEQKMTWEARKRERTEYYKKYVHKWKLRPCTACNGSGYYDHNGSPPCGACNGTGKERYKVE